FLLCGAARGGMKPGRPLWGGPSTEVPSVYAIARLAVKHAQGYPAIPVILRAPSSCILPQP
ncbi:MAG: hypothetical protein WBL43_11630, partial [Pseudolabrys sp.]